MKRGSGVLLHISSLPGEYGEGSFGAEAKEFVDFLCDCGFSFWQTLPFCMPDRYNSPYKSFSAFSGNINFIDLPTLKDQGLITAGELEKQKQQSPYVCEFQRLAKERIPLLERAAGRALEDASFREKLRIFAKDHPHIDGFCRFMAKKAANGGKPWYAWQEPRTATLLEKQQWDYRTWLFAQYMHFTQWMEIKKYANDRGVRIIGDIPFYVDYDSADVWEAPELFQLDERNRPTAVAGVPPDYFSEDGQIWGNPLYDWERMKAENFDWWRQRMQNMLSLFDGVRIDHFRGLEAYFCIPAKAGSAKEGHWVKGPGRAFVDSLKTVTKDRLIIAEDLGVITKEVQTLVEYSGFPGMRVLQFAFMGDPNSPHLPHNYPQHAVAYTGTHDNNTLLGYVWALDPGTRKRLFDYCSYGGSDLDGGHDYILKTMFASHAGLLILPLQDLLRYGEDTRMNTPGLEKGNWGYRVTRKQLYSIDRNKFRSWNELYGRVHAGLT